ncbi:MAG: hypothetical protein AB7S41_15730 [Parvibaculaceae bacterium]
MVRLYLGLAVLAIAVLVLFWNSPGSGAKVARWVSIAYLVLAATLLAFGIGM